MNHASAQTVTLDGRSGQRADSRNYLIYGQVAEEVNACLRTGQEPDVEALVRRYPNLADAVREMVATLVLLHQLGARTDAGEQPGSAGAPVIGQLGDFQILREVGRGGMGVVYEAIQISLGRRVALKVLPFAATLDAKSLQRFKNEAQAAAQLQHTNIVPVYYVGCERGVHFYAMQFIDGQTLAKVIADWHTGVHGRHQGPVRPASADFHPAASGPQSAIGNLESAITPPIAALSTERSSRGPAFFHTVAQLGMQAAEALEHAHQSGVVHRDIKPANLLVDGRSRLWVTDFGLAHCQAEGGLTLTGDLVGTLRYMSPEQALARRGLIDHRTDIYSLGVTLYELLTFVPAYSGSDRQELLRQIAFEEPRPPRRLIPALPVELETVVLKAMAKEPVERYATAQELADDLRRFLEDKPVRARRPTLRERAAKWARRHRRLLGAAVVLLVVAFLGLAAATVLIWREQQNTRAALAEARAKQRLAHQVVDEMFTDLADQWLEHEPHQEWQQRKFLLKALAYYQQFARENATDPEIRQATGKAAVRAGDIQQRLGEFEEARRAYAEAAHLFEQLTHEYPDRQEYQANLAECANSRGILLRKTGQLQAALGAFRQSAAIFEKMVTDSSPASAYRLNLITAHINVGGCLIDTARSGDWQRWYPEAERTFLRAHLLSEQLATEDPQRSAYQDLLGKALSSLGHLYLDAGRLTDAEDYWRRSLAVIQPLVTQSPNTPAYRDALAETHYRLGCLLTSSERDHEAEPHFSQSVILRKQLADNFPRKLEYRIGLATSSIGWAALLSETGRFPEAEKAFQEALAIWRELDAKFLHGAYYQRKLANGYDKLGIMLKHAGRLREAEQAFNQAVGIMKSQLADAAENALSRSALSDYQNNLGFLYWTTGRQADAERLYREVLALRTRLAEESPSLGVYRVALAAIYTDLAHLLQSTDRYPEAEEAYRQALARWQEPGSGQALDARSGPGLPEVHYELGQLLRHMGRLEEAREEFRKVAKEWGRLVERSPDRPGPQNSFARFLADCPDGLFRDPARAVQLANRAVKQAPQSGPFWSTLGMAHYRAGNYPAALAALEKASQLRPDSDGLFFLAMAHWQLGHEEQASESYERAIQKLKHDAIAAAASTFRNEAAELLGRKP